MMDLLNTNLVGIVALIVALGIAGVLTYLYKKGEMKTTDLSNIANLIDKASDMLEGLGKGDSIVNLFADMPQRQCASLNNWLRTACWKKIMSCVRMKQRRLWNSLPYLMALTRIS